MDLTQIQRVRRIHSLALALVFVTLLSNLNNVVALNNVQSIQYLLQRFNTSRSTQSYTNRQLARTFIKETLDKQGYKTELQDFTVDGVSGINVVGRRDGRFVNSINNRIFIVGAYYDSYKTSPGVNAGGSGLTTMLQVARQYSDKDHECDQNSTIVFVAFDQSQDCSCGNFTCCYHGSREFIKKFTEKLGENSGNGEIVGSVILGSIMNFDQAKESQNFSKELKMDVDLSVRDVVKAIENDGNHGDFILAIGRQDGDTYMLKNFSKYYNQGNNYDSKFKLREFSWQLQEQPGRLNDQAKRTYRDLFNGDHYSFWNNDPMVKAIYLTDTANFRGYMKYCYRNSCDTYQPYLSPIRGQFMANIADTITMMARNVTGLGYCTTILFGNISKRLYGESGEFTSPGYPKHYPNRANSVWYITVPSKFSSVKITFPEFELEEHECTNDYVEIFDEFSDENILGHFCGKSPPVDGIKSKSRYMKVVFQSDSYDTYKGFKAKWTAKGSSLRSSSLVLVCLTSIMIYIWT